MVAETVTPLPIAEALRLIRTREGLTQTAASKRQGAPDFRTLSHWETRRKLPSLKLLSRYLRALDLDFCDLQEALDEVAGRPSPSKQQLEVLAQQVKELVQRVQQLEAK